MADERYENGKVYLLSVGDDEYVGSTCKPMNDRLSGHRSSERGGGHQRRLYDAVEAVGGWDNVEVHVLEHCPCGSALELMAHERFWYDLVNPTLNGQRPVLHPGEATELDRLYRASRREHFQEYQRQWREANREHKRAADAAYHAAHREERLAGMRAWAARNAESQKEKRAAYYAANRERILAELRAQAAAVREENGEAYARHLEKSRERSRKHYQENSERMNRAAVAKAQAKRAADPEAVRAREREWYAANKEQINARVRANRAAKRAAAAAAADPAQI